MKSKTKRGWWKKKEINKVYLEANKKREGKGIKSWSEKKGAKIGKSSLAF